jgi:hypothetical protein
MASPITPFIATSFLHTKQPNNFMGYFLLVAAHKKKYVPEHTIYEGDPIIFTTVKRTIQYLEPHLQQMVTKCDVLTKRGIRFQDFATAPLNIRDQDIALYSPLTVNTTATLLSKDKISFGPKVPRITRDGKLQMKSPVPNVIAGASDPVTQPTIKSYDQLIACNKAYLSWLKSLTSVTYRKPFAYPVNEDTNWSTMGIYYSKE